MECEGVEFIEAPDAVTPNSAPSPILKKSKGKKRLENRPDFQLSFAQPSIKGRSDFSICKPLGLKQSVASKFYTERPDEKFDMKLIDANITKLYERGPKEKFKRPITDNHNYGWHHCKLINNPNPDFNFAKDTSFQAQFRILEIALDEKLQINKPRPKINKK